jgi:enolase
MRHQRAARALRTWATGAAAEAHAKAVPVWICAGLADTRAQGLGWGVVVSSEPASEAAETTDDFVAHLAVGTKAGQFRAGGLCNAEHVSKYAALLRIATDESQHVPYAGAKFRNFN